MLKISLLFKNLLRIKNTKFSGYCFYLNINIYGDFQICISVPLRFFFLCGYLAHPAAIMLWAYYCSVKRTYHPCKVTDKLPIAAVSCY